MREAIFEAENTIGYDEDSQSSFPGEYLGVSELHPRKLKSNSWPLICGMKGREIVRKRKEGPEERVRKILLSKIGVNLGS